MLPSGILDVIGSHITAFSGRYLPTSSVFSAGDKVPDIQGSSDQSASLQLLLPPSRSVSLHSSYAIPPLFRISNSIEIAQTTIP